MRACYQKGGEFISPFGGEFIVALTQIIMFYHQGKFSKEEIEIFENICKEILSNGSFVLSKDRDLKYLEVISKWAEKEILFFDPLTLEVKGNNRIYEKGMERLSYNSQQTKKSLHVKQQKFVFI